MFLKAGSQLRLHCSVDLGEQGPDQHFLSSAVLHWFLGQRLIDPGAGRERGVTTHTRIRDMLEVRGQRESVICDINEAAHIKQIAAVAQICLLLCGTDDARDFLCQLVPHLKTLVDK